MIVQEGGRPAPLKLDAVLVTWRHQCRLQMLVEVLSCVVVGVEVVLYLLGLDELAKHAEGVRPASDVCCVEGTLIGELVVKSNRVYLEGVLGNSCLQHRHHTGWKVQHATPVGSRTLRKDN